MCVGGSISQCLHVVIPGQLFSTSLHQLAEAGYLISIDMSTSTGCRLMAPLNATCQTISPLEDLQPSEDDQHLAQRTKLKWSST